jgi:hypothetical protein
MAWLSFFLSLTLRAHKVSIYSTASFSVKFGGNAATVAIEGCSVINFGKIGEKYLLSRRVPDTKVRCCYRVVAFAVGRVLMHMIWSSRSIHARLSLSC